MASVADDFVQEQERVRNLLVVYDSVPSGGFGAAAIREVLARADRAAMSGDVIEILRSYEELKGCE